jgi:molybdenum cofactor synthesis domain-containing protein
MSQAVTAAVLIIGNEILSGRTKDKNIAFLGHELNEIGIRLLEARVVADEQGEIVDAVNTLRARYDYVFTTGGIGPTHDDITSDSIAAAFGVGIDYHPDVYKLLKDYFESEGIEANQARMRMARVPDGAELIDNDVSLAPGFQLENVFVLAGVPSIARSMFARAKNRLRHGAAMLSRSVRSHAGEGTLAKGLSEIQHAYTDVEIGSYPWSRDGRHGTSVVARSTNGQNLDAAAKQIFGLVDEHGGEPVWETDSDT